MDASVFTAFRLAIFNVVSILTGTGYSPQPITTPGDRFAVGFFFCDYVYRRLRRIDIMWDENFSLSSRVSGDFGL